jgi:2-oxoisovalerate dehydrogenase E1 component beta subunit
MATKTVEAGAAGHGAEPRGKRTDAGEATYLIAIAEALWEEMERDERVYMLGEDIGAYGGAFKVTEGLIDKFGEKRVIDTPISEAAIVGSAIGASYMGMRPVCEIQFIDFIACCFDMLTNFAATSRYRNGAGAPIVVRGPAGGGVGGGPFHSLNPEAFFLNTPGLKMVEPSTAYDAKGLLKAAIRDDDPVLYFEHKFLYRRIKDDVPEEDYVVPIGKAAIRREGSDLSIITFGAMVHTALEAAAQLEAAGVQAEVIDLRSLAPLDREAILASVAKTSRALLLYEARRTGGIGGELAAIIAEEAFEYLDAPIMRIASVDAPVPYAPPLEAAFLPSVEKVVAGAKRLVEY